MSVANASTFSVSGEVLPVCMWVCHPVNERVTFALMIILGEISTYIQKRWKLIHTQTHILIKIHILYIE